MPSQRKNRALYIDKEALYTLALAKEGILSPVVGLMDSSEANEVDKTKLYKGKTLPFSFVLAPSGKRNSEILSTAKTQETLDLVTNGKKHGELIVKEVFRIDPLRRVELIYGTRDTSHPGVANTIKRLGNLAVYGDYSVEFDEIERVKLAILEAKKRIGAKHTTALMMAAKPLHRAHERLIRLTLDKTDMIVIFLLKPYTKDELSYQLRYKTLDYFVKNYLPKNRVLIVPLENTYIFAGYNELILDAIVAQNYGCDRLIIGQNHAGLGMYYDKNELKSIFDTLRGLVIEIETISEFVYCNICRTLVSTNTCPHGQHHHISYHSDSILELFKLGMLPPAVLVRKEISAIILSELFPNRFKNIEKLYYDIMPFSGILESRDEKDFYIELMNLYQTTSLS